MLSNTTLTFSYFICISLLVKQVEVSFETKTGGAIQHLATDTGSLKIYIVKNTTTCLKNSGNERSQSPKYAVNQTRRRIIEISGDGAYDTRSCHNTIRVKRAVPLISTRKSHSRILAVVCQKLYGFNKK